MRLKFYEQQLQATLEHIIPLSQEGTDDLWNLTLSCSGCNQKRGTTGFVQFLTSKYVLRKQKFILQNRRFRWWVSRKKDDTWLRRFAKYQLKLWQDA
jgi:hypothetical protein